MASEEETAEKKNRMHNMPSGHETEKEDQQSRSICLVRKAEFK